MIFAIRLSGPLDILAERSRRDHRDPGTLFVQDTGRPMQVEFLNPSKSIFVNIPRAALRARIGTASMTSVVSTKLPVVGLAAEFLTMLASA